MKEEIYLITGGTGTIGRQAEKELLRMRKKVRILTRNSAKITPSAKLILQ